MNLYIAISTYKIGVKQELTDSNRKHIVIDRNHRVVNDELIISFKTGISVIFV